MKRQEIHVLAPATVANVCCGFDMLGFCLNGIGDIMHLKRVDQPGIRITSINGFDLPLEVRKNVAGMAALAMYDALQPQGGFEISLDKKIKPGSGIGSSAASAAGAVYGINKLLGEPCSKEELTGFAIKGEAVASQCEHADNLAPALFGGMTLVKSISPVQVLKIPIPEELVACVLHPHITINTAEARALLPAQVSLENTITQSGHLASLIHGMHTNNYDLISDSLTDVIVEPHRSKLIPNFSEIKSQALKAGALGCGISGSGPSIFALCRGMEIAQLVSKSMAAALVNASFTFDLYTAPINLQGCQPINQTK
ncbi:homoserine kinase [Nonlabens xiamenensis]|uniref:homoserine kinase n=1 Tax=Nonlabens xiamenensis TaxID=2341043 RepID=UPI000F60A7ED|nr:homoserine kinase [Nonlabens xiamenensis]